MKNKLPDGYFVAKEMPQTLYYVKILAEYKNSKNGSQKVCYSGSKGQLFSMCENSFYVKHIKVLEQFKLLL